MRALASLSTRTASEAVCPCGRKPPSTLMACGMRPTCPMTATPAPTIALAAATRATPPPAHALLHVIVWAQVRTRGDTVGRLPMWHVAAQGTGGLWRIKSHPSQCHPHLLQAAQHGFALTKGLLPSCWNLFVPRTSKAWADS